MTWPAACWLENSRRVERFSVASSKTGISQTFDRGLAILELLAQSDHPLSAVQIAEQSGASRDSTYRLLRTLQHRRLAVKDLDGRFRVGPRFSALAANAIRDLRSKVAPIVRNLADELGVTTFFAILDGEECVTFSTAIPQGMVTALVQEPGTRHSVSVGAPGKAILSVLSESSWPKPVDAGLRREVEGVWRKGFATSQDEVLPGVFAVAVPVQIMGEPPGALAALYLDPSFQVGDIIEPLKAASATIESLL